MLYTKIKLYIIKILYCTYTQCITLHYCSLHFKSNNGNLEFDIFDKYRFNQLNN